MRRWQLNQLIRKHGGNCALCGDPVNLVRNHEKQATRDHVIPLSKGGADHIGNMQLACSICNNRKADSLPQLS